MHLTPTQLLALNTRLRAEASALREYWNERPECIPCDKNDEDLSLAYLLEKAASAIMASMDRDCEINEHLRRLWINKPLIDRGFVLYGREIQGEIEDNRPGAESAQEFLDESRGEWNRLMAAITKRLELVDKS